MRQRNMVYTGPMMDTEIEHAYLHPEPYSGHGPLSTRITFMAAPRVVPFVPHNQLPFPGHQVTNGPDDEFKGKITEGFHVNFQYSYPTPGSAPFVVPEYIGFNVIPVVLNQTTGAVDLNIGLQFIPMSHDALGQPVQVVPVPAPWLDQHFFPNFPGMPYMQGYTNGNPVTYMHQPLPPMPQLQPMPRFVQPTPPTGFRVYQPHDQELVIESNSRNHGLPHLRALPEAEVAMFNFANYGHRIDQHRDMRLDIDHMSYEELLALGEQIGNAGSGLSQDFILGHLKMRIFTSSNMLDATSADQNTNLCTICQMDYNDQEKIGMLECNHEYHVECIEKWLVEKNSCPVCKCTGLAIQGTKS
ncbi:hypothetical protein SSX86_032799 [Deinandra increscens subsp. villosa]|uniref:RING-type E3 ubiquitin transferase n=1 Tax=Deinandra increscens subsp. villosa TaxID=3103831 RepID=A0AAP0GGD0_9ASTR